MDCAASLQSTMHNWTIAFNSTTSNVICIVLNKRYFAFTFPIDFAMVMSPQAASGLDGVSASRHKNEAQTQYSLHHPCLLGVPMVGRNQYGYITPAFLGSPGGIFALRAHCALVLDHVPPEEPPSTPLGNPLRLSVRTACALRAYCARRG